MVEFLVVSTGENSSEFNSSFDNFRKPRQELKDKVREFCLISQLLTFELTVLQILQQLAVSSR